jgi:hypothetical protein
LVLSVGTGPASGAGAAGAEDVAQWSAGAYDGAEQEAEERDEGIHRRWGIVPCGLNRRGASDPLLHNAD